MTPSNLFFVHCSLSLIYVIFMFFQHLNCIRGEPIACCLWGKYAEQIESHVQEANDPNMILVIRFAKIGFYQGNTNNLK